MYSKRVKRELCGVEIAGGKSCRNYKDSCPHHKNKRANDTKNTTTDHNHVNLSGVTTHVYSSKPLLTSNSVRIGILADQCSNTLGLEKELIIHDYWLIATLYKAVTFLGTRGRIMHPYRPNQQTGHMVFAGDTSLSAAWDISQRYSEDIDIAFIPEDGIKADVRKTTMKWFATTLSIYIDSPKDIKECTSSHCFFSLDTRQGITISVDVVSRDSGDVPVLIEQK